MSILDNELVKRYFCCKQPCPDGALAQHPGTCRAVASERVLDAMQQPINEWDKVLELETDGRIREKVADDRWKNCYQNFHGFWLRLPDRFGKPDPVETKIEQIANRTSGPWGDAVRDELRALVRLARGEK